MEISGFLYLVGAILQYITGALCFNWYYYIVSWYLDACTGGNSNEMEISSALFVCVTYQKLVIHFFNQYLWLEASVVPDAFFFCTSTLRPHLYCST